MVPINDDGAVKYHTEHTSHSTSCPETTLPLTSQQRNMNLLVTLPVSQPTLVGPPIALFTIFQPDMMEGSSNGASMLQSIALQLSTSRSTSHVWLAIIGLNYMFEFLVVYSLWTSSP